MKLNKSCPLQAPARGWKLGVRQGGHSCWCRHSTNFAAAMLRLARGQPPHQPPVLWQKSAFISPGSIYYQSLADKPSRASGFIRRMICIRLHAVLSSFDTGILHRYLNPARLLRQTGPVHSRGYQIHWLSGLPPCKNSPSYRMANFPEADTGALRKVLFNATAHPWRRPLQHCESLENPLLPLLKPVAVPVGCFDI